MPVSDSVPIPSSVSSRTAASPSGTVVHGLVDEELSLLLLLPPQPPVVTAKAKAINKIAVTLRKNIFFFKLKDTLLS